MSISFFEYLFFNPWGGGYISQLKSNFGLQKKISDSGGGVHHQEPKHHVNPKFHLKLKIKKAEGLMAQLSVG